MRDLVLLARQTPSDFSQICGQATGRYADAVSYAPTTSISGLNTTTQSLVRENGCFLHGKLVNGTRRFHGYGNFFDRVWFSDDWIRPPETSYNVEFHPAGSPDTIYRHFNDHGDMSVFAPDLRYHNERTHPLKLDVPRWLLVALPARDQEVEAARMAKANANSGSRRRSRHSDDDENPSYPTIPNRSMPPDRVHQTIERRCIACGGSGWVTTLGNFGRRREPCKE